MSRNVKTKRAARPVWRPAGAAKEALQEQVYQNQDSRSTVNRLAQAADVLCLLAFFPVTKTARTVLFALFERRIERAYEGVSA